MCRNFLTFQEHCTSSRVNSCIATAGAVTSSPLQGLCPVSYNKKPPQRTGGRCSVFWQQFMLLVTLSLLHFCYLQNSACQLYQLVTVHCLTWANFHLRGVVITLHGKARGSLDKHPQLPAEYHYLHFRHNAKGQTFFFFLHMHSHTPNEIYQVGS